MRIKNKMTANSYVRNVRKKFENGIVLDEVLNGSSPESITEVKKANSEFLVAAIDYISWRRKKYRKGIFPHKRADLLRVLRKEKDW